MVTSSLLCPAHTGQTVPPAAAAAAVDLTPITELIVPALDPQRPPVHQGLRQFFPGGVIDGLHGAPGHLHIGAALLLRETLPVDQADGLILIHRQDHSFLPGATSRGVKLPCPGHLTDLSALHGPWHALTSRF